MPISTPINDLKDLLSHLRSRIEYLYNPNLPFAEPKGLREKYTIPHKGLYLSVISATDELLAKEGFLKTGLENAVDTGQVIAETVYKTLKANAINFNKYATSTVYLIIVIDVKYIADPLAWDETKDGIFFQWGQRYKGMYLPYEIQKMGHNKITTLDKLCSLQVGVVSNLWRQPCGLVWKLSCSSVSG